LTDFRPPSTMCHFVTMSLKCDHKRPITSTRVYITRFLLYNFRTPFKIRVSKIKWLLKWRSNFFIRFYRPSFCATPKTCIFVFLRKFYCSCFCCCCCCRCCCAATILVHLGGVFHPKNVSFIVFVKMFDAFFLCQTMMFPRNNNMSSQFRSKKIQNFNFNIKL